MSAPANRPCANWIDGTGLECDDPNLQASVAALTTKVLWAASGRRYGLCTTRAMRPCKAICAGSFANFWPTFWPQATYWRCGCVSQCSCDAVEQIALPRTPVASITEIKVDGVILANTKYRVDGWRWLVRTDGEAWPSCQDLSLADTAVGTWSVKWQYGRPVPADGTYVANVFAKELLKGCGGDKSCQLPRRVQTITRQGVTIAMLDPMSFLDKGLTGIYEVDLWIRAVNPAGLRARPRVFRADDPARAGRAVGT